MNPAPSAPARPYPPPVSVVLVGNTRSGRGRSRRLFQRFRARLESAGYRVIPLALGDPGFADAERFDPERFRGAHALIACGGDGTVNALANAAVRTGTPLYHIPTGNENLFARAFHMTRDPGDLIRALQTRHVLRSDLGRCAGRHFLIMVSLGPDAGVIDRLHRARTRALGHLAYAGPMLGEAFHPTLPRLSVTVDGHRVVDHRRGWLVVGNHRHYAARINFASRAVPDDGLLDVVFMPAANLRDCVNWLGRAWARRHRRDPRLLSVPGRRITVEANGEALVYQFDGEAAEAIRPSDTLEIDLDRLALPVLTR